jgi:4-methyl-5(b-hydroxyethyl)-thiazole monophosphate biosynthesis
MAPHALADVESEVFDLVVLPGGEPGTTGLAADARLGALLDRHRAAGRSLAAICAAPRVLAARGFLRGLGATSHPSVEGEVRAGGAAYSTERVVRDGQVLTSRGPGTALEFALAALDLLGEAARAADLRRAMLAEPG